MKYKLICADIDGTLLNDDKKLLPEVVKSLRDAARAGIKIALVSGRMPAGVELIERELNVQCIKVCNAGTYILSEDRCISSKCLSLDAMQNIYENVAKKNNIPLWIFKDKKWFVTDIDKYVTREMGIIQFKAQVASIEELAKKWSEEKTGPNKLLLAADPDVIPRLYREMTELSLKDINFACSAEIYIEIFPTGVTKGKALSEICKEFNISKEETIAFGDQELDISLIEEAGTGIAMGNAIKELKDKADFVTKSNNEAGIAYALKKYLAE